MRRRVAISAAVLAGLVLPAAAQATPVCTDGYMGGPSRDVCGGRIFPEAHNSLAYIQFTPNPAGFAEYQHGIEFLAKTYPRWVSVTTLRDRYGKLAVSAGPDQVRPYEVGDAGDGRDIHVVKVTDHDVPDEGKQTLFFSLSVHGNERGGLEGGVRTAEDLAIAATQGGRIADGMDNYASTTGRKPEFHSYEVKDLLREMVVYLVDLNPDGWAVGDFWNPPLPMLYSRGNAKGTDLNRQMPGKGYVNPARNPLQESEARYGVELMEDVAKAGVGGKMAYGADVHGELTSQAYMDIMYPAGQFDSVEHRRLMAIAERTKSVIDATLFQGIIDQIEDLDGGNDAEGSLKPAIPTKPAHWATVWDTLGYTDTGFIGDYLATELGVTGMDYEIFFNHTVPEKAWTVALQENHVNATRGIIKTAMAYAMTQEREFNDRNVVVDPKGRAGYVVNPDRVTSKDGAGAKPGPKRDGIGADGKPVEQQPYDVSNQQWFEDTNRLMPKPFLRIRAEDVARDPVWLERVDTLVLSDITAPAGAYDRDAYFRHLGAWVRRGGNLVLTDRGLHALSEIGVLARGTVRDIKVYQPYANLRDLEHPLLAGLRPNARQLVEAPILGYGIGNSASPMTIIDKAAFEKAGGRTVGTTGNGAGDSDDQTQASIGEIAVGEGKVRVLGGALPTPSEQLDHRFGLRDYALTYTGLFIMENAIVHDVAGLGIPVADARTKCVSRRRFALRLPRGTRLRGTTVTVGGRRAKVRRSRGRLVATVDLRGRGGPSRVVVRIVRRTAKGTRVVERRAYRVCVPRQRR